MLVMHATRSVGKKVARGPLRSAAARMWLQVPRVSSSPRLACAPVGGPTLTSFGSAAARVWLQARTQVSFVPALGSSTVLCVCRLPALGLPMVASGSHGQVAPLATPLYLHDIT